MHPAAGDAPPPPAGLPQADRIDLYDLVYIQYVYSYIPSEINDCPAAGRRVVGAIFLAIGIFGTPALLYLTRKTVIDGRVVADERDEQVARRATQAGLVCVLVYVFLTCIALWDRYQPEGAVPAGWMWVLAYSTLILAYIAPAAASLFLHLGIGSHAEG